MMQHSFKAPLNQVNMVFRSVIEQGERPFLNAKESMHFPIQAKRLVAELAILSFTE